jgi:hypothetical protein
MLIEKHMIKKTQYFVKVLQSLIEMFIFALIPYVGNHNATFPNQSQYNLVHH